jgi:hypothetical protein
VGPGAGATLLGEAAPLDDTRGTFA